MPCWGGGGGGATGLWWVEARSAAAHPTMHLKAPQLKDYPVPNVCRWRVRKPALKVQESRPVSRVQAAWRSHCTARGIFGDLEFRRASKLSLQACKVLWLASSRFHRRLGVGENI